MSDEKPDKQKEKRRGELVLMPQPRSSDAEGKMTMIEEIYASSHSS